jgi:hypothetical protein
VDFAARVEHAAEADGREEERKLELRTENRRPQTAVRHRHALPRTERHVAERAGILAQRDLVFRAAIDIRKHHRRKPPARRAAQIFDVEDAGKPNRTAEASLGTQSHGSV